MRWTLSLAALVLGAAAANAASGTFRFLTQSLPDGSTNLLYEAPLLTANAAGNVTFSLVSVREGNTTTFVMPAGLSLSSTTGLITNRPTNTFNGTITFQASDGTSQIQISLPLKISASGGGGNAGLAFAPNIVLPDGRSGVPYRRISRWRTGRGRSTSASTTCLRASACRAFSTSTAPSRWPARRPRPALIS